MHQLQFEHAIPSTRWHQTQSIIFARVRTWIQNRCHNNAWNVIFCWGAIECYADSYVGTAMTSEDMRHLNAKSTPDNEAIELSVATQRKDRAYKLCTKSETVDEHSEARMLGLLNYHTVIFLFNYTRHIILLLFLLPGQHFVLCSRVDFICVYILHCDCVKCGQKWWSTMLKTWGKHKLAQQVRAP